VDIDEETLFVVDLIWHELLLFVTVIIYIFNNVYIFYYRAITWCKASGGSREASAGDKAPRPQGAENETPQASRGWEMGNKEGYPLLSRLGSVVSSPSGVRGDFGTF